MVAHGSDRSGVLFLACFPLLAWCGRQANTSAGGGCGTVYFRMSLQSSGSLADDLNHIVIGADFKGFKLSFPYCRLLIPPTCRPSLLASQMLFPLDLLLYQLFANCSLLGPGPCFPSPNFSGFLLPIGVRVNARHRPKNGAEKKAQGKGYQESATLHQIMAQSILKTSPALGVQPHTTPPPSSHS